MASECISYQSDSGFCCTEWLKSFEIVNLLRIEKYVTKCSLYYSLCLFQKAKADFMLSNGNFGVFSTLVGQNFGI